ncbi:MAG: hypothetical protein ABSA63_05665 [Thermoplasmata archaeon]|jgi:hypothetical protein
MRDPEMPFVFCQAHGREAAYPPDESMELYVALHFPDGRHGILEKPLGEAQLRTISKDRALNLEVPQAGAALADLVFLCDHHAEVALEIQPTGTSPPLVLDLKRTGME